MREVLQDQADRAAPLTEGGDDAGEVVDVAEVPELVEKEIHRLVIGPSAGPEAEIEAGRVEEIQEWPEVADLVLGHDEEDGGQVGAEQHEVNRVRRGYLIVA